MSLSKTQGFAPVAVAIVGNALVTVLKFMAALASGSSAMFSEAVHSFADTINQVFLLIGLRSSLKKADKKHAYGYGRERFFWALVSACGIFFVGAGITFLHGVETLLHPSPVEFSPLVFIVLAVSFIIESYTLVIAVREVTRQVPKSSWRERLEKADTATVAVLLEDSVAVFGVVVAASSISLSYLTGNPMWDAVGAVIIAGLLAFVAITLILKNRSYLLGMALPEEIREGVLELVQKEPAIEKIIDFKSSALGFGVYRIKCEVEFNGTSLLKAAYRGSSLQEQYEDVKDDVEDFKRFAADFADRIPRLMGKKVDEIEEKIRKHFPMIHHIDIEIN